ncbi:MAG: hypothetical protein Fur0020_02810 [Thermodesulfovibrionia bacterium]
MSAQVDIEAFSDFRKEKGLRNLEPQSLILISKGVEALDRGKKEDAIKYFESASSLSPDLPQSYIYLAKVHFSLSSEGLTKTIGYIRDAIRAFLNNFWWSFRTAGNFLIALYISVYMSAILLVIFMIIPRFNLYVHDIHEDKRKLLLLLPSLLLLIFGPIFGVLAFILPFWVYLGKRERVLLYVITFIIAVFIYVAPSISVFLNASSNTTLKNIININSGLYTGSSHLIKDTEDFESAFTQALDLKRRGRYKEAIEIYSSLIGKYGHSVDAKLYNNIANCYVGLNDNKTAIKYYTDAIQADELASTYYNLSQMHREFFDFKKGEEYYNKALSISTDKVNLFTGLRGTTVNSFVVDEILSVGELWSLAFRTTTLNTSSGNLERALYFTNRWLSYVILLLIIIALNLYGRLSHTFAYRCVKCGGIQCSHCEKRIVHGNMCHMCYRALADISSLNVKDRITRIVEIQHYRERMMRIMRAMTLVIPGSGYIFFEWTIQGFVTMFIFILLLCIAFMWTYLNPSVAMSDLATLFRWLSLIGLVIVYAITVSNVFRKVPRRWR